MLTVCPDLLRPTVRQDGAAAVGVWLLGDLCVVANVGDAKAVLARTLPPAPAATAATGQVRGARDDQQEFSAGSFNFLFEPTTPAPPPSAGAAAAAQGADADEGAPGYPRARARAYRSGGRLRLQRRPPQRPHPGRRRSRRPAVAPTLRALRPIPVTHALLLSTPTLQHPSHTARIHAHHIPLPQPQISRSFGDAQFKSKGATALPDMQVGVPVGNP